MVLTSACGPVSTGTPTAGHLLTPSHFDFNAPGEGPLFNPWGITQAPSNFGTFSSDILIGNVEDGRINAFDPSTGAFLGSMQHPNGTPVAIAGLWYLAFGAGSPANGKTNELFFTAGPNAVDFAGNGLFGEIIAAGNQSGNSGGALIAPLIADPSATPPASIVPGEFASNLTANQQALLGPSLSVDALLRTLGDTGRPARVRSLDQFLADLDLR